MVLIVCRVLVWLASLLVPGRKRAEWTREWAAELWHRAQAGATPERLIRCASGAFRDAVWFLEKERKEHGLDLFRPAMRLEALFLAAALLICAATGALNRPTLPYKDTSRLVMFQRDIAFAGAINPDVRGRLLETWEKGKSIESIAPYRILLWPEATLYTTPQFFDIVGVKPSLGRAFEPTDWYDCAVVSYDWWQRKFHADPNVLGKTFRVGGRIYKVIGVMPRGFYFRSPEIKFYAIFPPAIHFGGVLARIKPGATLGAVQNEVRQLARTIEPRWRSEAFGVVPVLVDTRLQHLGLGVELAGLAALLSAGFVVLRSFGRWKYCAILAARVFLVVFGLCLLRMPFLGPGSFSHISNSIFGFWMFLLLCVVASVLLVIDHRRRCPVCLKVLRRPVAIGSYASQLLDQPATEYICPSGHGTLYIAETGNAPDHWTVLDESWQELFAHTEP